MPGWWSGTGTICILTVGAAWPQGQEGGGQQAHSWKGLDPVPLHLLRDTKHIDYRMLGTELQASAVVTHLSHLC